MSVSGVVMSNLDNVVFNKGYMLGTISGHAADQIAFGALQNVTLNHEWSLAELRGPEALPPLAVGVSQEQLTGSYEYGVIHPEQYVMAVGGSMAVSGANTIYTKLVNEEPPPFDLHFESGPAGQDDLDVMLYNCLMPTMSLRMEDRAFVMGTGNFRCYGQSVADGGKLFTLTKPGNLTNSS